MILRIGWGEDYMSNYKTAEKQFEYVRKSLPLFLRANDYLIQIREATVDELEEFREIRFS